MLTGAMPCTSIQRAQPSDAHSLHTVQARAFRREAAFYGIAYVPPPGLDTVAWHERMLTEAHYFKILCDGAIVGGIVLIPRGETCMELRSLFIDEPFQNRGIGAEAVHIVEASYPGVTRWLLATPYRSLDNQRFYERLGYVRTGETAPLSASGFRLWLYAKDRIHPQLPA